MSRNGDKISKPVKCISSPTPVCVVSWSGYLRCQLPTLLVLRCNALVISPPPNGPLHTGTYVLKTTTSWSGYLRCQLPTLLVLRCNALVISPPPNGPLYTGTYALEATTWCVTQKYHLATKCYSTRWIYGILKGTETMTHHYLSVRITLHLVVLWAYTDCHS